MGASKLEINGCDFYKISWSCTNLFYLYFWISILWFIFYIFFNFIL